MSDINHIIRFAVVGTIGFIINTTVLLFGVRAGIRPSLAGPLGSELAIISNFILNNLWTFSDRSLTSWQVIPGKFLQFNILSFGSAVIQFTFLRAGEAVFGLKQFKRPFLEYKLVKKLPLVGFFSKFPIVPKMSLYFVIYMFSVGVGMVVNYVIYSQIIWK